ncbi:MAG: hypothetical protein PUC48_04090, partial [Paraprevotella sp.]|nr:hypothetical protein [Paraprevotella sp.]
SRSSGRKNPIVENGLRFSFFREKESHSGEWTSVLVLQNLIVENGHRFSFFGKKDSHRGGWTSILILRGDRFP